MADTLPEAAQAVRSDRRSRATGTDPHVAGEAVWCSVCRLDRMRRSRAARVHKAYRDRRRLHALLEALR